jgi:lipid-A-disaccharide synthase
MKLLLLAGEESGVHYARRIEEAVRAAVPSLEVRGYGDYGFGTSDLAVFGIWAVLRRLFFFMRVKRTMERAIDEWRPDVVCTVDYPGMNLKLAAYAKRRGVRTVHVVCPQVWAWRSGRIPRIERSLDRLCCFFPFEPGLFRDGFATFVGHPLVQEFAAAGGGARRPRGSAEPLVAVLPGSRLGEIERNLPVLLEAVRPLKGVRVAIPAANGRALAAIEGIVGKFASVHGWEPGPSVQLGGARELLLGADVAAVASGTATLEAALALCPTVLVYRVSPVLAFIMRHVVTGVRHAGLANIIAEKAGAECPMPELLQEDFTAEATRACLEKWLSDPAERERASAALARTVARLGSDGDAYAKIAREVAGEFRRS